ncbi:hypothetical protein C8J57DRAFT_1676149 [Mycena rebaudengoi]|nr:hypothetical protein C8J57DRAFT_1676149 [Mycena rebaudengoi]
MLSFASFSEFFFPSPSPSSLGFVSLMELLECGVVVTKLAINENRSFAFVSMGLVSLLECGLVVAQFSDPVISLLDPKFLPVEDEFINWKADLWNASLSWNASRTTHVVIEPTSRVLSNGTPTSFLPFLLITIITLASLVCTLGAKGVLSSKGTAPPPNAPPPARPPDPLIPPCPRPPPTASDPPPPPPPVDPGAETDPRRGPKRYLFYLVLFILTILPRRSPRSVPAPGWLGRIEKIMIAAWKSKQLVVEAALQLARRAAVLVLATALFYGVTLAGSAWDKYISPRPNLEIRLHRLHIVFGLLFMLLTPAWIFRQDLLARTATHLGQAVGRLDVFSAWEWTIILCPAYTVLVLVLVHVPIPLMTVRFLKMVSWRGRNAWRSRLKKLVLYFVEWIGLCVFVFLTTRAALAFASPVWDTVHPGYMIFLVAPALGFYVKFYLGSGPGAPVAAGGISSSKESFRALKDDDATQPVEGVNAARFADTRRNDRGGGHTADLAERFAGDAWPSLDLTAPTPAIALVLQGWCLASDCRLPLGCRVVVDLLLRVPTAEE